jgi:hypothetical protein
MYESWIAYVSLNATKLCKLRSHVSLPLMKTSDEDGNSEDEATNEN